MYVWITVIWVRCCFTKNRDTAEATGVTHSSTTERKRGGFVAHLLLEAKASCYNKASMTSFPSFGERNTRLSSKVSENWLDATYRLVSWLRPLKLPYVMVVMLLLQRTRFQSSGMPASVSLPSRVMWLSHISLKEEMGEGWGRKRLEYGHIEVPRRTHDTKRETDK